MRIFVYSGKVKEVKALLAEMRKRWERRGRRVANGS